MRTFLRLMSFTRGIRWLLILGMACALGVTITSLAIPWLVGIGVDRIEAALDEGAPLSEIGLWTLAWGVIGLALLIFTFSFARRRSTSYVGHQVEYRMRKALFDHMLNLSHGFYDRASTGELVSRSINDLRVVRSFVGFGLFQLFLSIIMLIVVAGALFYKHATLAALVLVPMPLVALAAWRFANKVHPIFSAVQKRLADLTTSVQENVSGIRVVKSFAREPFERGRFGERAEGVFNETMAARRLWSFYVPGSSFLPATSVALLVLFGGRAVINGTMSLGDFLFFQMALMQLVWPMRGFGQVIDQGQKALAASERVFKVLDSRPEVMPPSTETAKLPEGPIGVEFDGVSFDYGGDGVLFGVSLKVEPGESVAIVGDTGAGKSTLLSLVPRFYDPARGRVFVGGKDVRNLDLDELRRDVGLVPQETFLSSNTVRENIAFGNPDATEEEVVRAAMIAGVHDQIVDFPEGYDEMVGEQSYKQVKHVLGWSDYQVRSDLAIRRHWQLVCCAFSFCWWAHGHLPINEEPAQTRNDDPPSEPGRRGEKETQGVLLARGPESGKGLVGAMDNAQEILAGILRDAPTASAKSTA